MQTLAVSNSETLPEECDIEKKAEVYSKINSDILIQGSESDNKKVVQKNGQTQPIKNGKPSNIDVKILPKILTSATNAHQPSKEAVFIAPKPPRISVVPTSLSNVEMSWKKMKLSTVAKKVPLINTVGNQSKLIPLSLPVQYQVSSASTVPQVKVTPKLQSILHARLTAPSEGLNIVDSSQKQRTTDNGNLESEGSSIRISKSSRNVKPFLSFEKGLTRLVAVQSRTVTMVDVSTQVCIPECDAEGCEEPSNQLPHLPSGSAQFQAISSSPSNKNKIVVLDARKKLVAIPKQIISDTLSVGGNTLKRKADGPIKQLLTDISNGAPPLSSKLIKQQLISEDSLARPLETSAALMQSHKFLSIPFSNNFPNSSLNSSDGHSAAPSLSFETVTTSSSLSSTTVTPLPISDSTVNAAFTFQHPPPVNQTSSVGGVNGTTAIQSIVLPVPNTASNSNDNNMDSLVLPLSSSIKFDGSCPVTSSMVQVVPVSISQHSNSIILPFNAAVQTSSSRADLTSLSASSNTAPFFIVVSNNSVEESDKTFQNAVISSKCNGSGSQDTSTLSKEKERRTQNVSGHLRDPTRTHASSNFSGMCSMSSKEEISELLKAAFADFKNCTNFNEDGQLPIHVAVEANKVDSVKRQCILLKARKSSVNAYNSKDETPLQLALYCGHSSIVKVLLEHHADGNICDSEGNTTLHLAVLYAEDALEDLLVSGQVDEKAINYLNDEGFSPLHLAAQHDKVEAISLLIEHGAEVDLPDGRSGRTALFHAIERKNYKAQQALEDAGADMKEPTFTGCTPYVLTRSDTIAQLTSGQNTFVEVVDSDSLLKPNRRPRPGKVK